LGKVSGTGASEEEYLKEMSCDDIMSILRNSQLLK
jgi:hypothetical protein